MSRGIIWPKILLFGDSLTEFSFSKDGCWGALLADAFCRKADIVPRGFSGYNTRMCRDVLPYIASELTDVTAATIFLGANDSAREDRSKQAVGLEEYKENLQKIIRHFQFGGVKSVVLISPPAFDAVAWDKHCVESEKPTDCRCEKLTALYAEACCKVAKDAGVPCVDLYTAMMQQENWRAMLNDGLHFNEKGSNFLVSQLLPVLQECLSGSSTYDKIMPDWEDVLIDSSNPKKSFENWSDKYCDK